MGLFDVYFPILLNMEGLFYTFMLQKTWIGIVIFRMWVFGVFFCCWI